MRKLLTIFIFLAVQTLFAQPAFFYHNQQIKEWYIQATDSVFQEDVRKVLSTDEIKALLAENKLTSEAILPFFHSIDFDQDGLSDLLFQGKLKDKNYVIIYKKKVNGEFSLIFNQMGEILQANLPNRNNPLSITIWNQVCCSFKVSTLTKWVCMIKNGVSYFECQEQSLVYRHTILPNVGDNMKPLHHFTINNEVAKLRMSPRLDDESTVDGSNAWKGNHISYHPFGATGVVYSSLKDKDNVTWYFIKINTGKEFPTKSDRFKVSDEIDDCSDYSYYGWIHGDNLNLIKP
ncbi:MAG: hypothetical protein GX330_02590 [Bacteroidales bacterium]|nr:hypothetical protein [Bacteroidales bacterium]